MSWLDWKPKARIFGNSPEHEPTKPTEPVLNPKECGFDGFVGASLGEFPKIEGEAGSNPDIPEPLESALKGTAIELYLADGDRLFIVADEADAALLKERRGSIYTAAEVRRVIQITDTAVVEEVRRWKRDFDGIVHKVEKR